MWQSWIEIEYYSIAYFKHINVLCKHMNILCVYEAHVSPAPSGSLALLRVKLGDGLEAHDGIIFDFYSGLQEYLVSQGY